MYLLNKRNDTEKMLECIKVTIPRWPEETEAASRENWSSGFPPRSNSNRHVQDRSLKF